MKSPFYKFLINQHLLRNKHNPQIIGNTILGIMIKYNRNVYIPLSEKYETIDFTPKDLSKDLSKDLKKR
jgi:hypothetical protein